MTADERLPTANDLPPGWVRTTLGKVCQVNPRMSWPESFTERTPISFVPMAAVDDVTGAIVTAEPRPISEVWRGYKRFAEGDVIFARITPCMENGKAAIATDLLNGIATGSTEFHVLRPTQAVSAEWVYYFVRQQSFRNEAVREMTGTAGQLRVPKSFMEEASIPLPPWSEQQRIVAKIESLFAQSRRGREALDGVPDLLAQFRQAVLAAAFRGDLTRRNPADEPASVLLERIRAERRSRWEEDLRAQGQDPSRRKYKEPEPPDASELPELPEGWTYTLLTPLLSTARKGMKTGPFGSALKKHEHRSTGVPVLGIENIGTIQFIPGSKIHITEEKAKQLSEYDAQPGDVLISRSGTVGTVCVVPDGLGEARISTNLIRVTLIPDGMLPKFFGFLFIGCPFVLNQVSELCKGTTRTFLNQRILSYIVFPLPPIAEQRRIVARIEALFAQADRLEAQVAATRRRLEQVDQAVLARAFRGELVEQDPGDEPASALLHAPGNLSSRSANQTLSPKGDPHARARP